MAVATSANYNKIIDLPGGKKFHSGAHVDFSDGQSIEIDDRNIMQGYPSIEDKVSEEGRFELGGAYASLLTLKLNNFEDAFKDYNFKGAVIRPWIGLTTAVHWRDGEIVEKIQRGVFTVTEAPEVNSIVSITAYDNLVKMDVKYSEKSTLAYPATLGQIAADVCSVCGVNLATAAFPNSDYSVAKRPDSNTITCREILKYVAQLAGCFAKCNRDGDVEIRWYEAPEHVFDIGRNAKTVSVALTDTKITGVQIKGNDDAGTVYSFGALDYAVRITDNPLAQDSLQNLVNALGTQLVNTQFASYSATSPMNPAIETGDIVWLTDKKGTKHTTIVSGLQIEFGDSEQFRGDAESEDENRSERFDKADKAQDAADEAQKSADEAAKSAAEAKIEIDEANAEIELRARKDQLISLINISPETIKIKSNRLEITGFVTFSDLEESGETTINGDNITTGKIESQNGDFWLDLDEGTFYLSGGTLATDLEWDNGSKIIGSVGNRIYIYNSDDGVQIDASGSIVTVTNNRVLINGPDVDIIGDISINNESTYSGYVEIMRSPDEYRTLEFENGLLVNNDV